MKGLLILSLFLFLIFALIYRLPPHFWQNCLNLCGFFSGLINGKKYRYQLKKFLYSMQYDLRENQQDLKFNYKFYTPIIEALLKMKKDYGGSLSLSVKELRKSLGKDERMERHLTKIFVEATSQFAMVSGITWVFVFMSQKLIPSSIIPWQGILGLQLGGLFFYLIVSFLFYATQLSGYQDFLKMLYLLRSLFPLNLPFQVVMSRVGKSQSLDLPRELRPLQGHLSECLKKLQQKGIPPTPEIEGLIEHSWELMEERMEGLVKRCGGLRLLVLPLFFISGYFLYVFGLISPLIKDF